MGPGPPTKLTLPPAPAVKPAPPVIVTAPPNPFPDVAVAAPPVNERRPPVVDPDVVLLAPAAIDNVFAVVAEAGDIVVLVPVVTFPDNVNPVKLGDNPDVVLVILLEPSVANNEEAEIAEEATFIEVLADNAILPPNVYCPP